MLRGNRLTLLGQIEGESREITNQYGSRAIGLTIKTPYPLSGSGYYDVYVNLGKSNVSANLPKVSNGDWVLLMNCLMYRRKVQSKDENVKDFYKTALRCDMMDVINLTLLIHQGQDYLEIACR